MIEFRDQRVIAATDTSPLAVSTLYPSAEMCNRISIAIRPSAGATVGWRLEGSNDAAHAGWVPLQANQTTEALPTTWRVTTNAGVAYTNDTAAVTDYSAATNSNLDALDTLANGDWVVAGYSARFNNLYVDMDAANLNVNAATLAVAYWNGTAWAAVAGLSDGTISGGATFRQDGTISWTMPTDWQQNTVDGVTAFHVRLSVSAALSAQVDVDEVRVIDSSGQLVEITAPISAIRLAFNGLAGAETITLDSAYRRAE